MTILIVFAPLLDIPLGDSHLRALNVIQWICYAVPLGLHIRHRLITGEHSFIVEMLACIIGLSLIIWTMLMWEDSSPALMTRLPQPADGYSLREAFADIPGEEGRLIQHDHEVFNGVTLTIR